MIDVRVSTSAAEDALSNELYNAVCPRYAFANEDAAAFKAAMSAADDHLAYLDGALAGSAFTAIRAERPNVVFALVAVPEPFRERGVGCALYDAVCDWARVRQIDLLASFVEEADEPSVAFAAKRGLAPVGRFERLVLELAEVESLDGTGPEGVQIIPWNGNDHLARGAHAVALEAYRDEPGGSDNVVEAFEDWRDHDFARMARQGQTFVALADGDVVGYSQLTMTAARPGEAAHAFTGVRRSWRGRGVAGALKQAQILWAKEKEIKRLVTQNEERNAPMLRINERLGYRPDSVRLLVRGPLNGGA